MGQGRAIVIAPLDRELERRALAELDLDVCPSCDGAGSYWEEGDFIDGRLEGWQTTCPTCKGEGRVDYSPCIACGSPAYDGHDEGCPVQQEEVRA